MFFKFLLISIDVFSRYAWVRPLKNKKHDNIVDALKDIFQGGRIPTELRTGIRDMNAQVAIFYRNVEQTLFNRFVISQVKKR